MVFARDLGEGQHHLVAVAHHGIGARHPLLAQQGRSNGDAFFAGCCFDPSLGHRHQGLFDFSQYGNALGQGRIDPALAVACQCGEVAIQVGHRHCRAILWRLQCSFFQNGVHGVACSED